jgi:hypothetical protein
VPVGNSFDHLIGFGEQRWWQRFLPNWPARLECSGTSPKYLLLVELKAPPECYSWDAMVRQLIRGCLDE